MNAEPPPVPPPPPPPGPVPPPVPARGVGIAIGFGLGVLLGCVPIMAQRQANYAVSFLVLDAFVVPIIAVILAIIPRTRPFGLGLLLACGLGWLILLSICSGAFRHL